MNFNDFFQAYLDCALWTSTNEEGEYFDNMDAELSEEAEREMREDCEDFFESNTSLLEKYCEQSSIDCAGHDFWLTRNGHGAGFWDRGMGDLGDELTSAAKVYGSQDLYLGDDGMIYLI